MIQKIKKVVTSPLFTAALAAATGALLIIKGDTLYAGMAFGVAICQFLTAFKTM